MGRPVGTARSIVNEGTYLWNSDYGGSDKKAADLYDFADRERRRSRNGSGIGYGRLRWNDRGDLFWDLFYPSVFLCDHEDFCSGAQEEAAKLNERPGLKENPVR